MLNGLQKCDFKLSGDREMSFAKPNHAQGGTDTIHTPGWLVKEAEMEILRLGNSIGYCSFG